MNMASATLIAREIKKKIFNRTGKLTASAGVSFIEDIDDTNRMFEILENIADRLENSLIKREAKGRTITLKLKYFDFKSITRSVTIDKPAAECIGHGA
jgi:nucleotidyltransferase/DNA polymerase involved in DNA repair